MGGGGGAGGGQWDFKSQRDMADFVRQNFGSVFGSAFGVRERFTLRKALFLGSRHELGSIRRLGAWPCTCTRSPTRSQL